MKKLLLFGNSWKISQETTNHVPVTDENLYVPFAIKKRNS